MVVVVVVCGETRAQRKALNKVQEARINTVFFLGARRQLCVVLSPTPADAPAPQFLGAPTRDAPSKQPMNARQKQRETRYMRAPVTAGLTITSLRALSALAFFACCGPVQDDLACLLSA